MLYTETYFLLALYTGPDYKEMDTIDIRLDSPGGLDTFTAFVNKLSERFRFYARGFINSQTRYRMVDCQSFNQVF
jgi:hypothetical protein